MHRRRIRSRALRPGVLSSPPLPILELSHGIGYPSTPPLRARRCCGCLPTKKPSSLWVGRETACAIPWSFDPQPTDLKALCATRCFRQHQNGSTLFSPCLIPIIYLSIVISLHYPYRMKPERLDAAKAGERTYTSSPCRKCSSPRRYTSTGRCVACSQDNSRRNAENTRLELLAAAHGDVGK